MYPFSLSLASSIRTMASCLAWVRFWGNSEQCGPETPHLHSRHRSLCWLLDFSLPMAAYCVGQRANFCTLQKLMGWYPDNTNHSLGTTAFTNDFNPHPSTVFFFLQFLHSGALRHPGARDSASLLPSTEVARIS